MKIPYLFFIRNIRLFSMKIKYLFFIRNIRLVKFSALKPVKARSVVKLALPDSYIWFTGAYILKTGVARFLCGLLKHILKNIFVKLIFKTSTLENSKKKGPNILPRPGIRSLCLNCSGRLIHPRQSFRSGTNCLLHRPCRRKN